MPSQPSHPAASATRNHHALRLTLTSTTSVVALYSATPYPSSPYPTLTSAAPPCHATAQARLSAQLCRPRCSRRRRVCWRAAGDGGPTPSSARLPLAAKRHVSYGTPYETLPPLAPSTSNLVARPPYSPRVSWPREQRPHARMRQVPPPCSGLECQGVGARGQVRGGRERTCARRAWRRERASSESRASTCITHIHTISLHYTHPHTHTQPATKHRIRCPRRHASAAPAAFMQRSNATQACTYV